MFTKRVFSFLALFFGAFALFVSAKPVALANAVDVPFVKELVARGTCNTPGEYFIFFYAIISRRESDLATLVYVACGLLGCNEQAVLNILVGLQSDVNAQIQLLSALSSSCFRYTAQEKC